MFKYFFVQEYNLPPNVGFNAYGKGHLIWLFAILIFIIFSCIKYRKLSDDKRQKVIFYLGILLVVMEIVKDTTLILIDSFYLEYLPFHLCGVAIIVEFLHSLKPSSLKKELMFSLFLPGALSALLFPNWTMYPFLNFMAIHSFIIHGLLILYPLLLLTSGEFKPNYKNLPKCMGFLLVITIPIYIFNKIFGTNFLFVNYPSPGSPLVPLEQIFGNPGYILGVVGVIIILWIIIYLPYMIYYKKKN